MRIFITHILPDEHVSSNHLSWAACNFCKNIIKGDHFDKVYSTMPPFVSSDLSTVVPADYEIVYSSLHRKGVFFRYLAVLHDQFKLFLRVPLKDVSIWLYNITTLNLLLFILLRLFKSQVKIYVIAADYTPNAHSLLSNCILHFMNRADGMISLSETNLYKCSNRKCIPGVVPSFEETPPFLISTQKTFLLSGVLNEHISSISRVLPFFSKHKDYKLFITGTSSNISYIEEYAAKYDNIVFLGQLQFNEYLSLLHSVTFQLSMRDPEKPENQFNFPSKIIEAVWHNRIVISTIEYSQLSSINYFPIKFETIEEDFNTIVKMPPEKLIQYANQSGAAKKMWGKEMWRKVIKEIESINT